MPMAVPVLLTQEPHALSCQMMKIFLFSAQLGGFHSGRDYMDAKASRQECEQTGVNGGLKIQQAAAFLNPRRHCSHSLSLGTHGAVISALVILLLKVDLVRGPTQT